MFEKLKSILEEKYEHWGQEIIDDDILDFSKYDLSKEILENDSFKLYRYMPASYYNIRNFETQKIHLSTNGSMNDVYEGLPKTSVDLPFIKMKKMEDLVAMTCLTEKNDNTLMWSHYACNHSGICIEYDLKKLQDDRFQLLNHLFPIIYREKRLIYKDIDSLIDSLKDLNEAIDNNYEYDGNEPLDDILPLFLTKGLDWKYEQEWRIIYTKKQMYDINDQELYGGNIKFECISAVYLGYRIEPEVKQNIIEICHRNSNPTNSIQVYQAKLEEEGYGIVFELIDA